MLPEAVGNNLGKTLHCEYHHEYHLNGRMQILKMFMKIMALRRLSREVELWGVVGGTSTGIVMLISASWFILS